MALQHLYMGRVMWHPGMWMNSLCQLLPIGFCGVVYELGKRQLSSSTTLLTQCFRKKPEEIFMALDFNFLGKPSSASPAPHGNTASIPTEGHDLHWHLYVTVPATRYPLGGSFVHTGTYVPTTLFCCKSPTEVMPPSCWQRLVTQFRLILNSPNLGVQACHHHTHSFLSWPYLSARLCNHESHLWSPPPALSCSCWRGELDKWR